MRHIVIHKATKKMTLWHPKMDPLACKHPLHPLGEDAWAKVRIHCMLFFYCGVICKKHILEIIFCIGKLCNFLFEILFACCWSSLFWNIFFLKVVFVGQHWMLDLFQFFFTYFHLKIWYSIWTNWQNFLS
jgi:hypothetical protein